MAEGRISGGRIYPLTYLLCLQIVNIGIAIRNKAERNTMENRIWLYDFHLFEDGGAGAEASTAGSESDVSNIQYGKSKDKENAPSQVGADSGAQDDLSAEWEALTGKGGKFHDLYGQNVSKVIQDRFKNQRDLSGQIDQISDGLSPLFMNYGLEAGDFEGLSKAIANDDAFYRAGAERAGLDVNQYKENLKLKAEAERGRQITEAYEAQQRQNEMFAQWESEAADLQQAFPAFDLGLELEHNEGFAKMLMNGVPVRDAFLAAHASEIFANANAHAEAQATQNVVTAIQNRAARPVEGAMHPGAAVVRKTDPSSLTEKDIDEINRRVAMGETVSF